MKKIFFIACISSMILLGSSCEKEKTTEETIDTPTPTEAANNTFGFGGVMHKADFVSYQLTGDSVAYLVMGVPNNPNDTSIVMMKGYGSNGPGSQLTEGNYTIVHQGPSGTVNLNAFEMIVYMTTMEKAGGSAKSGTVKVTMNNFKPTLTFTNISFDNSDVTGSAKIIVP